MCTVFALCIPKLNHWNLTSKLLSLRLPNVGKKRGRIFCRCKVPVDLADKRGRIGVSDRCRHRDNRGHTGCAQVTSKSGNRFAFVNFGRAELLS